MQDQSQQAALWDPVQDSRPLQKEPGNRKTGHHRIEGMVHIVDDESHSCPCPHRVIKSTEVINSPLDRAVDHSTYTAQTWKAYSGIWCISIPVYPFVLTIVSELGTDEKLLFHQARKLLPLHLWC